LYNYQNVVHIAIARRPPVAKKPEWYSKQNSPSDNTGRAPSSLYQPDLLPQRTEEQPMVTSCVALYEYKAAQSNEHDLL